MLRLVLFLVLCGTAAAQAPKPPTGAEGYMVYLLVGFISVTVTTGGQLVIAVLGHMKNGGKAADCKADTVECKGEPSRCFFGRNQHEKLDGAHGALHYEDEEGTVRPVLSGHWRRQYDETQATQTDLLKRLVDQGEEQTLLLRNITKPPEQAGEG